MATTYTPNLDLPKHEITDPFDITLINEAMDKTDAAVAGKAPAGYGLGTISPTANDVNAQISNGWFRAKKTAANTPITNSSAVCTVRNYDELNVVQSFVSLANGTEIHRITADGGATWIEEWVNPPMLPGVEYRTTERWNDKVVYTKAISVGAAAEGNYVVNDTSSAGVTRVLRYCGSIGTNALPLPEYSTWLRVGDNGGQLGIVVNIGNSAFVGTAVYAQAWYTKD